MPPSDLETNTFYVGSSSTPSLDPCASFPTLQDALQASTTQSIVAMSIQSSQDFPSFTVSNVLTLMGNSNCVTIRGPIRIIGSLVVSATIIRSTAQADFAMWVSGSLSLSKSSLQWFPSPLIYVEGRLAVADSEFVENRNGVISSLALGASVAISGSKFVRNSAATGGVLFLYPSVATGNTNITVTESIFDGNSASDGGSVALVNDYGVSDAPGTHSISFTLCQFRNQRWATFRIAIKHVRLTLDRSNFENESQLIVGSMTTGVVEIRQISVTNTAGPVICLQMTGSITVTDSVFTNIAVGPLLAVAGTAADVGVTVVSLTNLSLVNFTNTGLSLFGNLLNAQAATVLLTNVSLSNFTATVNGALFAVGSVICSTQLTLRDGLADTLVIGTFSASTLSMNDTTIEALTSRAAMSAEISSYGQVRGILFRNIRGLYESLLSVYTTNLFYVRDGSDFVLDGLQADLATMGTTLLYVYSGRLTVVNSVFLGPIGMGVFTNVGGEIVVRNTSFAPTTGRTILKSLLGGRFEFDRLLLKDIVLIQSVLTMSSGSHGYIGELVLQNVTTVALSKGLSYNLTVGEAEVNSCRVESLVHFSIDV